MADVAQELLTWFVNHPDRDLVSLGILGSVALAMWLYRNVYWTPAYFGSWTRRVNEASEIDDRLVKALCSVAPFLADIVFSPLHAVKGLGLKPSNQRVLEDIDDAFMTYIEKRAKDDERLSRDLRRAKDKLIDLQISVNELKGLCNQEFPDRMTQLETEVVRLGQHTKDELIDLQISVDDLKGLCNREFPDRMTQLETEVVRLEQHTKDEIESLITRARELEDAYITSIDESVKQALDKQLASSDGTESGSSNQWSTGAADKVNLYARMVAP